MSNKFPHLFSPLQVGTRTYKNRIESAPAMFAFTHFVHMPYGFKPNTPRRSFRMLEEKARGGAAAVVLGEQGSSKYDKRFPFEPEIDYTAYEGDCFEIVKKTGDMIHSYGALALGELVGVGETKPYLGDGVPAKGPTARTMPDGTAVQAFTIEEIHENIQDAVNFARWFQEAGWDGIMIHAGHGWLPAQFLSASVNKREDEYGGSLENRARFTVEMVKAVREAVGKDFVIEVRVSGSEHIPGGITLEETIAYCKMIEPYIDLIHVSSGHYWKPGRSWEFTTAYAPHGANIDNAAEIKKNVSIPVAVVGGINSPEYAEEIIAEGKVDMVALGRQMFADPDFPVKAMNGQEDLIRRCLRCAKCYPGPLGEHETERPSQKLPFLGSCTINPYMIWNASHQLEFPEDMPKPEGSRKVLVVGGGPGGMQAAITAFDRGHKVILAEKTDKLGGILKFTDHSEHKKDVRNFKDLLVREVGLRDIDVRLNTEVTPETIKEISPEALIIAVGSDDLRLPIKGIENAVTALEAFDKDFSNLGSSTIIIGGGLVGCESACDIKEKGIDTTIVEMQECLMPDNYGIYRTAVHDCLDNLGVRYFVNSKVVEIGKDYVVFDQNGEEKKITADSVINALGRKAKTDLAETLKNSVDVPTWVIGDCVEAKQIGEAIDGGWMAAMEIV